MVGGKTQARGFVKALTNPLFLSVFDLMGAVVYNNINKCPYYMLKILQNFIKPEEPTKSVVEPEKASTFDAASYEGKVQTPYCDFDKKDKDSDRWGHGRAKTVELLGVDGEMLALYDEKEIKNTYNDPIFIFDEFTRPILNWLAREHKDKNTELKIVDFGGGDGVLLDIVLKQMEKTHQLTDDDRKKLSIRGLGNVDFKKVEGVVLDLDSTGRNKKIIEQKKKDGEYSANLSITKGDVLQSPLLENSADIAISRKTIQYIDEKEQNLFLQNIHKTLKDNGLFIIQWPNQHSDNKAYNAIFNEITSVIVGANAPRRFPDLNEIKKQGEAAGFKMLVGSQATTEYFTVESFASRFSLSSAQEGEIREIFKKYYDNDKDDTLFMQDKDGNIALKSNIARLVFQKQ